MRIMHTDTIRGRSALQALQMTGERAGVIGSVSEEVVQRSRVREDMRRAEIRRNLEEGRKALEAGDVEQAERLVGRAVDSIERAVW